MYWQCWHIQWKLLGVKTYLTLYWQCQHASLSVFSSTFAILDEPALTASTFGWMDSSLSVFNSTFAILDEPALTASTFGWMDSFHPVLKIFYSNHLDSLCKHHKHSIQCIACFDLHIDSVDKQDTILNTLNALIFILTVSTNKIPYSIHNSIALILCINCLNMPFNVHTTDKVTMSTVSGFLTI